MDQVLRWCICREGVRVIGRDQGKALRRQQPIAGFLNHYIARKSAGILDNDGADIVFRRPCEKAGEAVPLVYGIGATHCRVIELGSDLDPRSLGIVGNGVPLPLVAVAANLAAETCGDRRLRE